MSSLQLFLFIVEKNYTLRLYRNLNLIFMMSH
jgi:hypothetical protein